MWRKSGQNTVVGRKTVIFWNWSYQENGHILELVISGKRSCQEISHIRGTARIRS